MNKRSDGATDRTTNIAKNSGATVIDNIVNRGLGKTIKRGTPKPSNAAPISWCRSMLTDNNSEGLKA